MKKLTFATCLLLGLQAHAQVNSDYNRGKLSLEFLEMEAGDIPLASLEAKAGGSFHLDGSNKGAQRLELKLDKMWVNDDVPKDSKYDKVTRGALLGFESELKVDVKDGDIKSVDADGQVAVAFERHVLFTSHLDKRHSLIVRLDEFKKIREDVKKGHRIEVHWFDSEDMKKVAIKSWEVALAQTQAKQKSKCSESYVAGSYGYNKCMDTNTVTETQAIHDKYMLEYSEKRIAELEKEITEKGIVDKSEDRNPTTLSLRALEIGALYRTLEEAQTKDLGAKAVPFKVAFHSEGRFKNSAVGLGVCGSIEAVRFLVGEIERGDKDRVIGLEGKGTLCAELKLGPLKVVDTASVTKDYLSDMTRFSNSAQLKLYDVVGVGHTYELDYAQGQEFDHHIIGANVDIARLVGKIKRK